MMNKHVPTSYLPRIYNRKNVMNETNGSRYDCKYVNDEIFISRLCTVNSNAPHRIKLVNNPQNAFFDNGKFYFDFPGIWYNANSINKAIGLRSIDIYIKSLFFEWQIEISDLLVYNLAHRFSFVVPPNMSSEEITSQMCYLMNNWLIKKGYGEESENPLKLLYEWDYDAMIFKLTTNIPDVIFNFTTISDDMRHFLGEGIDYNDGSAMLYKYCIGFHHIWNRKDVYVHSSFVNYTSFNYLGRNGEFYQKISKIYDFNIGTSNNFYFEVSTDGMNPITNPKELGIEFMVGLCFIVDDKKYNGE